jgi:hypothetical protein
MLYQHRGHRRRPRERSHTNAHNPSSNPAMAIAQAETHQIHAPVPLTG